MIYHSKIVKCSSLIITAGLALVSGALCITSVLGADPVPQVKATPIGGGWLLRTGVLPKNDAKASINADGIITIEGGGASDTWPRGTLFQADRANMTAAFVYKAFKGDFILTARRITFDKTKAHENSGSGLSVMGDLKGWDTPIASNAADFDGKPVWFRLIRKGDRLGLYEGPDGQRWMASNAGALIPGTVYAGLYTNSWGPDGFSKAQFDNVTINENPKFTYSTTWLGNEFEGGPKNTVNSNMIGLGVAPDGTCITTGVNGEQENCMGRYRDGQVLTSRPPNYVGDTSNAVVLMSNGDGLVAHKQWIVGFDWDKQNGKQGKTSEPIGKSKEDNSAIRGLAVYQDEVFAASRTDNTIVVLDLATLKIKRSFPFERPGPLAVDSNGVLWAVQEGWVTGHPYSYPYPQPFRILGLDRQNGKQVNELEGVELPTALCADAHGPSKARLLVADNGQDQQVKIFDVSGVKPKAVGTLGAKSGVYYGTPGEMKPGKFNGLSGVGTDAKGNIYTSTNGYPYRVVIPGGMPNISQLKAFAPSGIDKPEPDALWTLNCTGSVGCIGGAWDAKTGDAYVSGVARYSYDAKRGLGREWQLAGTTTNLRDDSDGESFMRTFYAAPKIRWIEGERFLFLRERTYRLDKNGNLGKLVRFTNFQSNFFKNLAENVKKGAADRFSEEALFGRFPTNTPEFTLDKDGNQVTWRYWEWVDGYGGGKLDGLQQREEYHDLTPLVNNSKDAGNAIVGVDDKDNWWITVAGKSDLQFRAFTGLKNGVPSWSDETKSFEVPKIFTRVLGVSYQSDRDIMDIIGQTADNPGGHEYQVAEAIRFTNWSTKPIMGARIVFMDRGVFLPWGGEGFWQVPHILDRVVGVSIAKDVVYATNRTGAIRAYDLNKGNLIEWMDAGPEVFGSAGFFDVADTAVNAYEVNTNEHLILRQSNWTMRILVHRWNPNACNSGRLPPAPNIVAQPRAGTVELLWGGKTGIAGTVKGYQVYRSATKDGSYQKMGGLVETASFRDKRTDGTAAWYRVSTVNLVGEGPQSEPVFAGAATTMAKRIVGKGRFGADGFDFTTRGNWQGVYGSEAAYLVEDVLAKGEKEVPRRYFTAGTVVWPGMKGGKPVGPSDDQDRLQSVAAPGMRCENDQSWWSSQWGPVKFLFTITDGKPHQMTIAYSRNATFVFRDIETGEVIWQEKVTWPQGDPKLGYVAFNVAGRFQLEMTGEPFRAVFIDSTASRK